MLYDYNSPNVFAQYMITSIAYFFNHIISWIVNTTIPLSKQDLQILLEQLYKQNVIQTIVSQHLVTYSTYLNPYCLSYFLNTCSELVLTSSKFLSQVSFR